MIKQSYYQNLGIISWQSKTTNSAPLAVHPLTDLAKLVASCTACDLHKTRTQTVFGVGNINAKLMIIGEAPGYHEDQQGEPFVGRAGKLLTAMLQAIKLTRAEVYIANILKCRPPQNRDPNLDEVTTCTPYLQQQILTIKPKLLLAVGRVAAHFLLQNKSSLEKLRQQMHCYKATKTPLIVTYHPAYLLRNPVDKKKAFEDLLTVREFLQQNH